MKRVFLAALVGMVVIYAWYSFSWLVLPWTQYAYDKFENEKFVGWILKENAPEAGVYVMPYPFDGQGEIKREEGRPFALISIVPKGLSLYSVNGYLRSFAIQYAIAFLLGCALLNLNPNVSFMGRVFFILGVAFVSWCAYSFSNWNWWGYSFRCVLYVGLDFMFATFLSALVIVGIVKPKNQDAA